MKMMTMISMMTPTSVETVHHSLISADGLVSIPHLRDEDDYDRDDDCDGEMNEDDDDECNYEYIHDDNDGDDNDDDDNDDDDINDDDDNDGDNDDEKMDTLAPVNLWIKLAEPCPPPGVKQSSTSLWPIANAF